MPGIRIIPARAGFTIFGAVTAPSARDHPRSRGVYVTNQLLSDAPAGSSPLARGLRWKNFEKYFPRRIIPARAGFTDPMSNPSATVRDHPRSRGVYSQPGQVTLRETGSSPLARGLPIG